MSRNPRLRNVDVGSVLSDYEAGTAVRTICETHRIGLSRLYRMLDEHHVPRREPNHAARIPTDVEDEIAAAWIAGEPATSIAKRTGVSTSTVGNVGRRRSRPRTHVRDHDETIALIVRWLFDGGLDETDLDVIARVGVNSRAPGLRSIRHVVPELRSGLFLAITERLHAELE